MAIALLKKRSPGASDSCLQPFLDARREAEAQQQLARLFGEEADRVIRGTLRHVGVTDEPTVDDLRGEVVVRIIARLRSLRDTDTADPIGDFRGFVAIATRNVYHDYLSNRYPRRSSLKRQLLSLLTNRTSQRGFALWDTPTSQRCCGFTAWQGQEIRRASAYVQMLDDPQGFVTKVLPREEILDMNPAVTLAALFNGVGGPIQLGDLVRVVADLWGVKDPTPEPLERSAEDGESSGVERPVDTRVQWENPVATEVEQRDHLRWLWSEICQLLPRQRSAMLLDFKDIGGGGVIELLELRGIASLRQVAAALEMPAEQLAALDPPLEDNAIAPLLGCTRQQVINLRKVARERLERRNQALEKSS